MSYDERTTLLGHEQQQQQRGHQHIIVVPTRKDAKDYEPIFTTAECSYGLTLDELLPYKNDPWWIAVRRICFASFWLIFTVTFLAALALAYLHGNSACIKNSRVGAGAGATAVAMTLSATPSPLPAMSNTTTLLLMSL